MNNPTSPLFCPNALFVGCHEGRGVVLGKEGFTYALGEICKTLPLGTPVLIFKDTVAESYQHYWRWPEGYVPSWIDKKNT